MDVDRLELIKKTAIKAIFSDDELFKVMALKGGNALDLIYNISARSSVDLDFSLAGDFPKDQLDRIRERIENALITTFAIEGLRPFDIFFDSKPPVITPEMEGIWGGYTIEFKLIDSTKMKSLLTNLQEARLNAENMGDGQKKKFRIDVSKFEYCLHKQRADLDGYQIQVYTLPMIVFEKLRAICQQMPEYAKFVTEPNRRGRGRDFFDIHTILEARPFDPGTPQNIDLIRCIFAAKRVPLWFLGEVKNQRAYHRIDFEALRDTLKPGVKLQDFDYYFDYVLDFIHRLESLGIK